MVEDLDDDFLVGDRGDQGALSAARAGQNSDEERRAPCDHVAERYTQSRGILRIRMVDRLPEDTQTLFSELVALVLAREAQRGIAHIDGAFITKRIRGREYVYFQYSDPGTRKRQFSIGPSSRALDALIAKRAADRDVDADDVARITRLARLLDAADLQTLPEDVGRVLRALSDAGVFRLGGVLVGSYAFLLLANTLGVHWPSAAWRTRDVDIAGSVTIGTPLLEADVPATLDSLRMGFVPVPQLDPRHPSTSFKVRGRDLRVDLIVPGAEASKAPVFVPRFRAAAAPLKHLSLLLEDAEPAVAIGSSTIMVRVPAPARFALHKLLLSQSRALIQQTKTTKDLHQAALLLEVLGSDRPQDLEAAAGAFLAAGKGVVTQLERALTRLGKEWPIAEAGVRLLRRELR